MSLLWSRRSFTALPLSPAPQHPLRPSGTGGGRGEKWKSIKERGRSKPNRRGLIYQWREGGERVERQRRKPWDRKSRRDVLPCAGKEGGYREDRWVKLRGSGVERFLWSVKRQ